MRLSLLIALCLAMAAPVLAQETPQPRVDGQATATDAQITINSIDIGAYPDVRIFATVLQNGEPLLGLTADDFRVREDEVDQEPLVVEPQLPPLSVVITLDTSGSMSRRMEETKAAAQAFVQSLGDQDSVQLVGFAREIRALTPMTTTKETVLEAIDTLVARGDTALYDATFLSVDLLTERRGRKAVVLLSDGVDDDGTGQPLSERTISDVLSHATASGVPVFVVGLGTEMDEAVLTDIAQTTGARYLNAPTAEELGAVYSQISGQLSGQYAIRYTSNLPADDLSRRVDLMALGQQDSRDYTPEGTAVETPVATLPADDGTCVMIDAIGVERPKLELAAERYDRDLITQSDYFFMRDRSVDALQEVFEPESITMPCAEQTLDQLDDLYESDLVNQTSYFGLRNQIADKLQDDCSERLERDGFLACLQFAQDIYDADLLDQSNMFELRDNAFNGLLELMLENPNFDDDMAWVGTLYDDDLINQTQRNEARQALLAAEQ